MRMNVRKLLKAILLGLAGAACTAGWAQQEPVEPTAERAPTAASLWPSRFQAGDDTFTVYPPQLERWEGDRLDGRAAVAVQAAGSDAPVFGAVSLSARTQVDAGSAMVNVRDIAVTAGAFPSAGD